MDIKDIDKEAVSKKNASTYSGSSDSVTAKNNYKAGLEYAEKHYKAIIEDREKAIEDLEALQTEYVKNNSFLEQKLLIAKELLQSIVKNLD